MRLYYHDDIITHYSTSRTPQDHDYRYNLLDYRKTNKHSLQTSLYLSHDLESTNHEREIEERLNTWRPRENPFRRSARAPPACDSEFSNSTSLLQSSSLQHHVKLIQHIVGVGN